MQLQNFRRLLLSAFLLIPFTISLYAQGNFVYINNNPGFTTAPATNSVSAFSVSPSGVLAPVPGSPFLTGGTGTGAGAFAGGRATICMIGNRLYVANQGSDTVSAFDINPATGVLTPVPGSPFATGGVGTNGMSLDSTTDGRFLMALNAGSSNNPTPSVTVFSIGVNGALAPVLGSPFLLSQTPASLRVSANGLYLFVSMANADRVEVFSIGANGALASVSSVQNPDAIGSVAGMDTNCASNLLFIGEGNSSGTNVDVLSIGAGGVLTPISGSPFNLSAGVGVNSNVVLLSPNEQFLFVSNQNSNTITVLNVAANGSLSPVSGSPFPNTGGATPQQMVTNQAGTLLYVNNSNGTLSVFNIAGNGSLTSAGPPVAVGSSSRPVIAAYPATAGGGSFTCPNDITVSKDPNQCGANVTFPPISSSGCGAVTCTPSSGSFFPVGTTTVTCSLGATQCSFNVTVTETLICPSNITVSNAADQCGAYVSFPPFNNCGTVVCVPPSGSFFPVGTTTVTCSLGASQCSFNVTVNDTQAPIVSCAVTTPVLWSPDHTLVNVGFSANVTDNCPGSLTITYQVFSNEDDQESGADKQSPDAKDIAPGSLRLRAERKGYDDGRVYLIVVRAVDRAGNVNICVQTVVVPHDESQASLDAINAQAAAAKAYFISNGAPPAGYFVIGDGPVYGSNQ